MFSNKGVSKITSNRSNKKTVRRVHTQMDESTGSHRIDLSNRQSQQHQSKQKYLDVYSKFNLKQSINTKKTFKVNNIKQPIIIKQIKTQPDYVNRKTTTQSNNHHINNNNNSNINNNNNNIHNISYNNNNNNNNINNSVNNNNVNNSLNNNNNSNNNSNNSNSKYQIDGIAGKGTFGTVFIGHIKASGQKIAIKKVLQDKRYKNRQLQILKSIKNQNCLEMRDYYLVYEGQKQYLNVVMDYYPYNLFQVIKKKQINTSLIKIVMFQILKGLNYLSTLSIAHRDIKPQNILIDLAKNKAVICDFGSAKQLVIGEQNLSYICSRCYRAPQLIFGAGDYTPQIDMWSTGCVLVEMINGSPPFLGDSQIDQLIEIIKVLGTPSKQDVLEMNKNYNMKQYSKFPIVKPIEWKSILQTKDEVLIDLVINILQYSPKKRFTPAQAIMHQYFNELRNENSYKELLIKYKNIPQLFHFSKDQLKKFQHAQQVIPKWVEGNSCGIQNFSKVGTITVKRPTHRLV